MMEVNRVPADLVRPGPDQASTRVDLGIVEHAHPGAAHVTHLDVPQVDGGARHEDHVAARAQRVLGPDHHIAADIAHVGQKFQPAVRVAGAMVVVAERRGQRDLIF